MVQMSEKIFGIINKPGVQISIEGRGLEINQKLEGGGEGGGVDVYLVLKSNLAVPGYTKISLLKSQKKEKKEK